MAIAHTSGKLNKLASPAIRIRTRNREADREYNRGRLRHAATEAIARFRRSNAWRKLSERFRHDHPTCEDPLGLHDGQIEPSRTVHHIEPLAARYDLRLEESNLSALCWRCHNAIEAEAERGEPTRQLFPREGGRG